MTFAEFRQERSRVVFLEQLTIEFLNLPAGQVVIIVNMPAGIRAGGKKIGQTYTTATTQVGCFEAWDIYRTLTA